MVETIVYQTQNVFVIVFSNKTIKIPKIDRKKTALFFALTQYVKKTLASH